MLRPGFIVVSLLAAGCGRIGFEATDSPGGGDEIDGGTVPCGSELVGDGSEETPYQACSAQQIVDFASRLGTSEAVLTLMSDIDFQGATFPGIGSSAAPFTGDINGKGFTISNLVISGTPGNAAGFVNVALGGRVQNINFSNIIVAAEGSTEVGAVIGSCVRSQVANISLVDAEIRGDGSVGGFIGNMSECQIRDSSIVAKVIASADQAGGVAGYADYGLILNVNATVDVSAALSNNVGGIVGAEGWSPLNIQRVHVNGSVVGNEAVAGLVGSNWDGAYMYRSSFTGTIRGNTAVGGFVGENDDSPFHIFSTSVTADIYGNNGVGGFSGRHYYRSKFYDSHFTGTITGEGPNQAAIGGFFGDVEYYGWVERSYVNVTIDSSATTVGGFVGHIGYWSGNSDVYDITDSFSVANISGSGPADTVSHFVGENLDPNPLVAAGSYYHSGATCQNLGSGNCGGGGVGVADLAQLQVPGSTPLASWDFNEVWKAQVGSFPTLRLEQVHKPEVTAQCPRFAIIGLRYTCDVTVVDADKNEGQFLVVDGSVRSCNWLATNNLSFVGRPLVDDASSCIANFKVTDGVFDSPTSEFTIDVHAGVVMTPSSTYSVSYTMGVFAVGSAGVMELFTLTNNESVAVSGLSIGGLPAGDFAFEGGSYPGTGASCGTTLGPGQTCTVAIRYLPTVIQTVSEKISINFTADRGPVSYAFTLSGHGT